MAAGITPRTKLSRRRNGNEHLQCKQEVSMKSQTAIPQPANRTTEAYVGTEAENTKCAALETAPRYAGEQFESPTN